MPGFDGTGPAGGGSMIGRGMGRGAAATAAVRDCGCGRGRGYRWTFYATGVPGCIRFEAPTQATAESQADNGEEEILVLREQANHLRNQLNAIEECLGNLAGQKPESGE